MRGMRLPPSVSIDLGPSPTAAMFIGVAGMATLGVILALPLAGWLQGAGAVSAIVWTARAFREVALRQGLHSVTSLRLAADRLLVVHTADGRLAAGQVRRATYVGAALTTVVWRPDGARLSRSILILPDMLPPEDFRRLRVLLRYARSDVAEGAPARSA